MAEFGREFDKKKRAPGGFEEGSYRAAPAAAPRRALTPAQQKLAKLEKVLPAALQNRAAALFLAAVVLAGSAVGVGGAKLRARYNEARSWYTVGVPADNGYTLADQLSERANTAANIITTAINTPGLGADAPAVTAAQVALDGLTACQEAVAAGGAGMSELYRADEALDAAVNLLYGEMQALADDPLNMGAVQTQYGRFNSAGTILGSLHYNEAVADYQNETDGFPASLLKGLFGVKDVEVFG